MEGTERARYMGVAHSREAAIKEIKDKITKHAENIAKKEVPKEEQGHIKDQIREKTGNKWMLLGLGKLYNKITHHWGEWSVAKRTAAVIGLVALAIPMSVPILLCCWVSQPIGRSIHAGMKIKDSQKIKKEFYEQETTHAVKDLKELKIQLSEEEKKEIYEKLVEIKEDLENNYPDKGKLIGDKVLGIEPKWWYKKLEAAIKAYKPQD